MGNTSNEVPELLIRFVATYQGEISYASIYKCIPDTILKGDIPGKPFFMTVMVTDKESRDFMSGHLAPQTIEGGFNKVQENVTQPRIAITGFVDENGNAWEADFLR